MDGYAWVDTARDGESNMAIDRLLLEAAERERCALLRLYRWSQPTLSLGHFQASADRMSHPPSANLPVVLRASGGGAIVHHHEWTYALAVPVGRNRVGAARHLYDMVHDALVVGLRGMGWDARKWSATDCRSPESTGAISSASGARPNHKNEISAVGSSGCGSGQPSKREAPFLCFQRRSCGDIVCGDWKVVGSAQRRLGASVLQHGSILCSTSRYAPELAGLAELPRGSCLDTSAARSAADRESVDRQSATDSWKEPRGGAGDHFLKNSDVENGNFGYNVLSWVVAPLFRHLEVSWRETASPPDLIDTWSRR